LVSLNFVYIIYLFKYKKAFVAIGKVAEAMGVRILPFLDLALQAIKEGLSTKG
jgi:hypothetical protein